MRSKSFHRGCLANANFLGQVADRWRKAHPNNIFYIDIVAKHPLFIIVNIDNTYQPIPMLSKIVKECRILTHGGIRVGGIIIGCLIITKEYNNAFAYLDKDNKGSLRAVYPITASSVNILSDNAGGLYCSFVLRSGKTVILPYGDIIHLRRYFNDDDVLGADNTAIMPGIELAQTQNEGIINGIKAGAAIRGILSFTQLLAPDKLKKEKEAFVADYLSMDNGSGVIATDTKMSYTPIENKPVILNADQAQEIKSKIYDYLGVTEPIVNSSYNEDQYSAFYESTLEPIATALSQEFTAKLFNDREQAYGNSILFESGRLQFTSNATKVQLIKELMPMGLLTINQALEILNLPGVTDGDRRLQALNMIDADKAAAYQGVDK